MPRVSFALAAFTLALFGCAAPELSPRTLAASPTVVVSSTTLVAAPAAATTSVAPLLTPTSEPTPTPALIFARTSAPEPSPTMPASATPRANQAELDQALLTAATNGDAAHIVELLQGGANVNVQDVQGRTPVMAATYGNHVAAVNELLKVGADVNLRDKMLNNPFLYAGAEGYLDILRLAHVAGADPTITNRFGGTALIPASEHGYVDVVQFLLTETEVDVNHVNNLGWTALLEAIILSDGGPNQQETVRLLIEHGADVNIADKDGVTPLSHALRRGFREIQMLLEAAGARE